MNQTTPPMFRGTQGKTKPATTRYTIVLEALPASAPAEVRLRQFLKLALRAFRMRCVEVKENGKQTAGNGD